MIFIILIGRKNHSVPISFHYLEGYKNANNTVFSYVENTSLYNLALGHDSLKQAVPLL